MAGRVKIKEEFPRKTFYERMLKVWKDGLEDTDKMRYVLYKAHGNMTLFPLDVKGIADLKLINGVGDKLAIRLDVGWDLLCEHMGKEPNWREVKALPVSEIAVLVERSKTAKAKEKQAKRDAKQTKKAEGANNSPDEDEFCERPKKIARTTSQNEKATTSSGYPAPSRTLPSVVPVRSHSDPVGKEQKRVAEFREGEEDEFSRGSVKDTVKDVDEQCSSQSESSSQDSSQPTIQYLHIAPEDRAEVILICDHREVTRGFKKTKGVVEVLQTKDIRIDLRPLSIGDFLWVARLLDGSEMVLDWVVERKTWQDLQSSIRGGRYDEQKQRLRSAPMSNRVYLIEGKGEGEQACRQAITTTLTHDHYLIQRCETGRETAAFLETVTERLKRRVRTQQMNGIRFEDLQEISKKSKSETVKETWMRQLMVCPGMSSRRALCLSDRFPSLSALSQFLHVGGDLSKELPQLPKSLIQQLLKFFE